MSINHYSNSDLSHPSQWWSHYSSSPPPNHTLHLSPDEDRRRESEPEIPKEHLFEKALTPSDVGKLNRLVIPKQHAERHFPMSGAYAAEPGENGLLLGFEDENGKSWRFRYSYWNSSQSYVLTKGWSRFVKEKKLDAGDVVVFARHRVDAARFFIGWRRRADGEASRPARAFNNPGYPYPSPYQHGSGPSSSLPYQPEQRQPQTNSKWLRLFGVNLECQNTPDESDSSTPTGYYYPDNHNHMDISFSGGGDVYRQG